MPITAVGGRENTELGSQMDLYLDVRSVAARLGPQSTMTRSRRKFRKEKTEAILEKLVSFCIGISGGSMSANIGKPGCLRE